MILLIAMTMIVWMMPSMAQAQTTCSGSLGATVLNTDNIGTIQTGDVFRLTPEISNNSRASTGQFVAGKLVAGSVFTVKLSCADAGDLCNIEQDDVLDFVSCATIRSGMGDTCIQTGPNTVEITLGSDYPMAAIPDPNFQVLLADITVEAAVPSPNNPFSSTVRSTPNAFTTDDPICDLNGQATASGSGELTYPPVPCIHVTKDVETCPTKVGDELDYTICVRACTDQDPEGPSEENLVDVQVIDTLLGGPLAGFPPLLIVGDPFVCNTFPYTVPAGAPGWLS
jgi:hypothetical protein